MCLLSISLLAKLPWTKDSDVTFVSSSQAATCPASVYHKRWMLHPNREAVTFDFLLSLVSVIDRESTP